MSVERALALAPELRQSALEEACWFETRAAELVLELDQADKSPPPDLRTPQTKLTDELETAGLAEAAEAVRLSRYFTAIRIVLAALEAARSPNPP